MNENIGGIYIGPTYLRTEIRIYKYEKIYVKKIYVKDTIQFTDTIQNFLKNYLLNTLLLQTYYLPT